jgi:hypothetical protein
MQDPSPTTEVVIEVARDYSRPEYPRFLVASDGGPETPESFVAHYAESHDFDRCVRTQNDCWEVLAEVVAGPLLGLIDQTDGKWECRGIARGHDDERACELRNSVALAVADAAALQNAWASYLRSLEGWKWRSGTLSERMDALEPFFGVIAPRFSSSALASIVDIYYRQGSLAGMPDLTYVRNGHPGFIEVKAPGDMLHDHQRDLHRFLAEELHLPVSLFVLVELASANPSAKTVFHEVRRTAQQNKREALRRMQTRLGPGNAVPSRADIPTLQSCSSADLIAFVQDAQTARLRFTRHIIQYNIPQLTDTECSRESEDFLASILGGTPNERWADVLVAQYRDGVSRRGSRTDAL